MFAAVAGKVTVVALDHRDARAHEAGDREDRDAGAQCERGVGMAEVVEMTKRIDTSRDLRRLPVAASETAEVDVPTARVGEEQQFSAIPARYRTCRTSFGTS